MTPSDPSNSKPFIFRFLDSLGVAHLCAALNHTHTMSEVTDLPAIESTPTQNSTKLVTSGGIFTALAQKAAAVHSHVMSDITGLVDALAAKATQSDISTAIAGKADTSTVNAALATKADKVSGATNNNFAALDGNGNLKDSGKKAADFAAAGHTHDSIEKNGNWIQVAGDSQDGEIRIRIYNNGDDDTFYISYNDLINVFAPDNTPTPNSERLVRSKGVYSAIAIKANSSDVSNAFNEKGSILNVISNSQTYPIDLDNQQLFNGSKRADILIHANTSVTGQFAIKELFDCTQEGVMYWDESGDDSADDHQADYITVHVLQNGNNYFMSAKFYK
jgi:hypothetical protein